MHQRNQDEDESMVKWFLLSFEKIDEKVDINLELDIHDALLLCQKFNYSKNLVGEHCFKIQGPINFKKKKRKKINLDEFHPRHESK